MRSSERWRNLAGVFGCTRGTRAEFRRGGPWGLSGLSAHGAKLLILTICCDDSIRSLLRARHAITYPSWDDQDGRMFHGNFWSHIEMDLNRVSLWKRSNC